MLITKGSPKIFLCPVIKNFQLPEIKNKLIESALRTGRLKRTAIKLLRSSKLNKKLLYALVSKTLKKDIHDAKQHYLKESQAIFKNTLGTHVPIG